MAPQTPAHSPNLPKKTFDELLACSKEFASQALWALGRKCSLAFISPPTRTMLAGFSKFMMLAIPTPSAWPPFSQITLDSRSPEPASSAKKIGDISLSDPIAESGCCAAWVLASLSRAQLEKYASRHPREPQVHGLPFFSITIWPISPAIPAAPLQIFPF